MALVKELKRSTLERYTVHGTVECTYCTFEKNGSQYLQIDTFDSKTRENPGTKSQTIQFGVESLAALKAIIGGMLQK